MSQSPASWSRNYQMLSLHKMTEVAEKPSTSKLLSPDRWSPSGWKYSSGLDPPSPYLRHPNKRNAYPVRTKCDYVAYPESLRLQTSSRLHYQRVHTEPEPGGGVAMRETDFSPLPASREKVRKQVGRLPKAVQEQLKEFGGYHEPSRLTRLRTASPVPDRSTNISPELKQFHKRKTLITEWMEKTIASRKK